MAKKATDTPSTLDIHPLKRGRVKIRIIGETPIIFNSMSAKAKRDLLLGGGRKTTAQKRDIKHDPISEFQSSIYVMPDDSPTLLGFPAPGIKAAMATAALETPGVAKTTAQRLIFVPTTHIPIWGVPSLLMSVVRSADMNKTPDIRSRAIVDRWASEVDIAFVEPTLNATAITHLLVNAGLIAGIGDFRQEKGKGSYGTFRIVQGDADEEEYAKILAEGGYDVQDKAMDSANPFDIDTANLLGEYHREVNRRSAA